MRSIGDVFYNFHWIAPNEVARSSQAYAGFLGPFLRRHGVRAVLNLRGRNPHWRWWRSEKRVCDRLGIVHSDIALSSKNLPKQSTLLALLDAFETLPRPILMKCSGGQDRTSFTAALYLLHVGGWNVFEEAMSQLSGWPYLHWPRRNQRWLRLFFDFAREKAGGRPLRHWVETGYRQDDFKAWLVANDHADAFFKLQ